MLAIATVTAALLALSATAVAATSKYHYHSYEPKRYDHGHEAYAMDYSHEPSYESHYRETHHDSYDEGYGGDAYSENSMKSRQTYRHKRSVQDEMGVREDQVLVPLKKIGKVLKKVSKKVKRSDEMGAREGQFFVKKLIFPSPERTTVRPITPTTVTPSTVKPVPGPAMDDDDIVHPQGFRRRRSTSQNQEVFPGCFSSPPEDCGADCVASFRQDEDCYQCCCMDKTVIETTCALPADGGDCRGNLKRWAFNEATGACEPFVYGGCGGNGNRFMCKEMCERHCVDDDEREGQDSTCPLVIEVTSSFGWDAAKGVRAARPGMFLTYTKGNREVGSGEHWVSDIRPPAIGTVFAAPDGFTGPVTPTHAIWRDGSNWIIGTIDNLGTSDGLAWIKSSKCPHNTGFGWKYFEPAPVESWVEAGRGLVVRKV